MRMKGKSLILLIVLVAAVAVCTGLASAYLLGNAGGEMQMFENGEPFSDSVRIENLVPGQSQSSDYTAEAPNGSVLTIEFTKGAEDALDEFLTVTVTVNEETLYEGSMSECYGTPYTADVSGEFTFSVSYSLDSSVGNAAQGLISEFTVVYTLEGGDQA